MSGRTSLRKGIEFERVVRRRLARVFGEDHVRRGNQYKDGTDCADVNAPRFWIECKAGKKPNVRAALRQAITDSEGKQLWALAVCKDECARKWVLG